MTDFKTASLNHSDTPPPSYYTQKLGKFLTSRIMGCVTLKAIDNRVEAIQKIGGLI